MTGTSGEHEALVPDDPAPFPPFERASSERIYDSPWCGLRRDEVVLPNGRTQEYHVFEISNAVAVVPFLRDGRVLLIGQYRYTHGNTHWEIPAGRIDEAEAVEDAAARELVEETGHRAGRLVQLPGFYPTNGISAHYAHLYLAEDCEQVCEPRLDDSEQIVTRAFTRDEVEALLRAGRIRDGFAALGLLYALLLGR